MKILQEVLKDITPDEKQVKAKVDVFVKQINDELKKKQVTAKAVVGGSIAKGTFLKGAHDCDIFVKFDFDKYKNYDISSILQRSLIRFKPSLVHGSRDYFQVKKGIQYEIVPVLDITDPKMAVNVTDMSPLHVAWVKKTPKLKKDIRLAKQFCKAQRVYGAESYIKGFSGHVLDILTIHYGGFLKLLEASSKWKDKTVIDPNNHYKGKALQRMNRSKLESPLIVIDPVLPDRNAAAALGTERFNQFKDAAKRFLEKPDKTFFKVKKVSITDIKKKAKSKKLILLDVTPLEGKEDVVGAKLLKAFTVMKNQLKFNDFKIVESDWNWDKKGDSLFWFIMEDTPLESYVKRIGPPLHEKNRVEAFKAKHKKTFTENNRICTQVKRTFTQAESLVKVLTKDSYIREKTKKVTIR